jgi:hypothetical protein
MLLNCTALFRSMRKTAWLTSASVARLRSPERTVSSWQSVALRGSRLHDGLLERWISTTPSAEASRPTTGVHGSAAMPFAMANNNSAPTPRDQRASRANRKSAK